MALFNEGFCTRGEKSDAVFVFFNFLWDTDDHDLWAGELNEVCFMVEGGE